MNQGNFTSQHKTHTVIVPQTAVAFPPLLAAAGYGGHRVEWIDGCITPKIEGYNFDPVGLLDL